MRLAFSTLGVPGTPLPEVLQLARDHRFHGVELRVHPEEPVNLDLGPAQRRDVVEEFADSGVRPLALAGYARVAAPGDDGPVVEELDRLLELAHDLGVDRVRVFPGGDAEDPEGGDEAAVRRLTQVAPLASRYGVRLLWETHDSHRTGADAARVLSRVGHPSVGALWDVLHTWRGGEQPETSLRWLAPYLDYVQVKDVASAEDLTPLRPGRGVLPLGEVLELLTRLDWDGWLCWEYEARWFPEVPPLAEGLPEVRDHLLRLLASSA
ncbi:sugar phosphate isomerase/epimerase family protein [Streptomyces sp. NPDC005438]|uniref:sugar phosphate isomerase/epimerase family protein n=1 Tax=Streptomyces sp. NPDC005438 TaxID=3156880 RepID=UPI0033B833A0